MKKIVIIGSGLGGLECGVMLAKRGHAVTVIEQAHQIGGCLQSYSRNGVTLDTGFHYIGGIEEGQALHPVLQRFGLLDLPWQKLDSNCADRIYLEDTVFDIPQGHEAFVEKYSNLFPADALALRKYVECMQHLDSTHFSVGAYDYLASNFRSPILRQVLTGAAMRIGWNKHTTSLFNLACITNSFLQSAYRLIGGGQQIVDRLAAQVYNAGGNIITNTAVVGIIEHDRQVSGIRLDDGEILHADIVISNISPAATINLLDKNTSVRQHYRKRLANLPLTKGVFTTTLLLKKDFVPYINYAIHIHSSQPTMIHFYPSGEAIDIMQCVESEYWIELRKRDQEAYSAEKNIHAEHAIRQAAQVIPNLKEAIAHVYTSTPATYERYLLAPKGTAFGAEKDYNNALSTILSPQTPLHGLFLTGQNLNLHGVLGVSMSALQTINYIENYLNNTI